MVLRSPLTVQPYDYIGDSNGRPLDKGQIYIGVAGQDPEFNQIPVYLDAEMTKLIDQPIRTNDGFVDFAGSLQELYALPEVYSVKVLDKQGRKVLYKGDMTRKNLMSDALAELTQAVDETMAITTESINTIRYYAEYIDNVAEGKDGTDATIDFLPVETGAAGTPVVSVVSGTPSARTIALTIPKGDKGADGKSAYQSALDNGFVGTEAEWKLYLKSDGSIQALQQFMTNPASTEVSVPDYGNIPSLQGYISTMFANGGLPATPFATKALMTASALVDGDYAMVTDGGADNGLYVKTAGTWVKSSYDPVKQSKEYADANALFKPQYLPTTTTNIDALVEPGMYMAHSDAAAVQFGLPNGTAGILWVTGTYHDAQVTHIYISKNGLHVRNKPKAASWSKWEAVFSKKYFRSTDNADLFLDTGNYASAFNGEPPASANLPYGDDRFALIVSYSSSVRQIYISKSGVSFRTANSANVFEPWITIVSGSFNGIARVDERLLVNANLNTKLYAGNYTSSIKKTSFDNAVTNSPFNDESEFNVVIDNTGLTARQYYTSPTGIAVRNTQVNKDVNNKFEIDNVFGGWTAWSGLRYPKVGILDLGLLKNKVDALEAGSNTPKVIYGWGSSTLELSDSYFTDLAARHNHVYVGHGVSGETLAVSGLQQGSNVVTVKFADATLTNNTNHAVTITQSFKPKRGRSYKEVELSNGVKGLLYFSENSTNANTFKPTNLTEPLAVDITYEYRAINPDFINQGKGLYYFNIGKNNMGYADTAQDIVDTQQQMIDYIPEGSEYLVGGHFVNVGLAGTDYGNKVVAVNQMLKLRYGLRFCDYYDFLYDDAIWTKYGITKTAEDIAAIAAGDLPPSLGRDIGTGTRDTAHLRDEMSTEIALQAEARFTKLGYFS